MSVFVTYTIALDTEEAKLSYLDSSFAELIQKELISKVEKELNITPQSEGIFKAKVSSLVPLKKILSLQPVLLH